VQAEVEDTASTQCNAAKLRSEVLRCVGALVELRASATFCGATMASRRLLMQVGLAAFQAEVARADQVAQLGHAHQTIIKHVEAFMATCSTDAIFLWLRASLMAWRLFAKGLRRRRPAILTCGHPQEVLLRWTRICLRTWNSVTACSVSSARARQTLMEGAADGDLLPLRLVKLKSELNACLSLPTPCRGGVSGCRPLCKLSAEFATVTDAALGRLADLHRGRRLAVSFVAWGCLVRRSGGFVEASAQTATKKLGMTAQAASAVSIRFVRERDTLALNLCFLAWWHSRPIASQKIGQKILSETAVQTENAMEDTASDVAVAQQAQMWARICLSAWRSSAVLQTCSRMCLAQASVDNLDRWRCIILWVWRLLASNGIGMVVRHQALLQSLSPILLAWHRAAVVEHQLRRLRYVEPSEVLSAAIVGSRRAYRAVSLPLRAEQVRGARVVNHYNYGEPIQSFVDRTRQTDGTLQ